MNINIVDAYIKFKNGLIIIISGLSGSNKSHLATLVSDKFKISKINLNDYCKSYSDVSVKLPNDITVTDWDHIDVYDWDKFNEDVLKQKYFGVVICGDLFPYTCKSFKTKHNRQ